jgi:LysM repeat protein
MLNWNRSALLFAVMLAVAAGGCSPVEPSAADEEKEPHFALGTSRFNSYDYAGAIEAYEEALEVNPRSAQAHYRLAQLFDNKQPDPAAAVYHYQQYLKLDKSAQNSGLIQDRIAACKRELAKDQMELPAAPAALKQVESLTETNRLLIQEIDRLRDSVKKWSDYAGSLEAAAKNIPPSPNRFSTPSGGGLPDDMSTQNPGSGKETSSSSGTKPQKPAKPQVRTYAVKSGETMAAIARKQGVSLTALQAANPSVNPKKLRAGQTLNLP